MEQLKLAEDGAKGTSYLLCGELLEGLKPEFPDADSLASLSLRAQELYRESLHAQVWILQQRQQAGDELPNRKLLSMYYILYILQAD